MSRGLRRKAFALEQGGGSVEVWSAVPPAQGFYIGDTSYGADTPDAGVWVTFDGRYTSNKVVPDPDFPGTVIESNGIRVKAGTYTVTVRTKTNNWPQSSAVFGVRAALDGAPVSGLSIQQTSSTDLFVMSKTATVTLPSGLLTLQGYVSVNGKGFRIGSGNKDTGLSVVPYKP